MEIANCTWDENDTATSEASVTLQLIKGLGQELTTLNTLYFSKQNREIVQKAIRRHVYEVSESRYLISNQNDQELMIIMREIYKDASKMSVDSDAEIRDEIQKLNTIVIEKCVMSIMKSIPFYFNYLADNNTNPMPHERPVDTNSAGTKGDAFFKDFKESMI